MGEPWFFCLFFWQGGKGCEGRGGEERLGSLNFVCQRTKWMVVSFNLIYYIYPRSASSGEILHLDPKGSSFAHFKQS